MVWINALRSPPPNCHLIAINHKAEHIHPAWHFVGEDVARDLTANLL
jgi:hypothetical protein